MATIYPIGPSDDSLYRHRLGTIEINGRSVPVCLEERDVSKMGLRRKDLLLHLFEELGMIFQAFQEGEERTAEIVKFTAKSICLEGDEPKFNEGQIFLIQSIWHEIHSAMRKVPFASRGCSNFFSRLGFSSNKAKLLQGFQSGAFQLGDNEATKELIACIGVNMFGQESVFSFLCKQVEDWILEEKLEPLQEFLSVLQRSHRGLDFRSLHQDDLEEKMVSIVLHAFKRGSLSWEKNAAIGKVLLSFRSQGMAEEQIRRWLSRSMEPLLLFQEGKWHLGDNDETKLLMQLMGYNKKIAKWISNQMGLLAAQGPFELLCQLVALAPSDPQKRWWDMLAHPVILFQAFQRGDLQLDNHASEAQYLFQKLASNPHGRDVRERAFAWLEQQIQMAASQGNKDLVQKMIEISPSSLHLREKWQDFLEE